MESCNFTTIKAIFMNRKNFLFEICTNGVESCLAAQEGGADRVELCAGIPEGGTTPSYAEIKTARKLLTAIRLHVIIRPRGGDFCYSPLELERMAADIDMARQLGADGVVFGCLHPDGTLDGNACRQLLAHCKGISVTFHRAFDRCRQPKEALEKLIGLGFDRVLTSGQHPKAIDGASLLHDLYLQATGRIAILAGSGVNEENILQLYKKTGIREYHFSAREPMTSPVSFQPDSMQESSERMITTVRRVKNTIAALSNHLNH